MEPENRSKREAQVAQALEDVWQTWSSDNDPANLTVESLLVLLETYAIAPVYAVWILANRNLLLEHELSMQEAATAIAFMLFFRNWARDIAERWKARVDAQLAQQPATEAMQVTGGGGGGGGGLIRTTVDPVGAGEVIRADAVGGDIELRPWVLARKDVIGDSDLSAAAATAVTNAHSSGEVAAAATVRSQGIHLIAIWRAEIGACKKCEELNGRREHQWKRVAPNGPGLHINCRCWLEWVPWGGSGI